MPNKLKTTLMMLIATIGLQAQTMVTTGDTLYSAMNKGVGKSTDKGNTWVITGYTQTPVNCIIVKSGKVYSGTKSGALVSGNGGTSWTKLTGNDVNDSNFVSLTIKGSDLLGMTTKNIYKLNGSNWEKQSNNITTDTIKKALKISNTNEYIVVSETKIYYSTDGTLYQDNTSGIGQTSLNGIYVDGSGIYNVLGNNGVSQNNDPMPVELSSLAIKQENGKTVLLWKTQTEINSNKFEIETNINNKWQKMGEVKASGNSNTPKEYRYEIVTATAVGSNNHLTSNNNEPKNNNLISNGESYRLKIIDNDGSYKYSEIVKTNNTLPTEFAVSQNYPNPFNPTTTISYTIPVGTNGSLTPVKIKVYDMLGKEVSVLVNEAQTSGYKTVKFDGTELTTGMYIYRIEAGKFTKTMKMMLIK